MTSRPRPGSSRTAFWILLLAVLAAALGLDTGLVRARMPRPPSTKPDTNCDSPAPQTPEPQPTPSFLAFGACGDEAATPRVK